MLCDGYWYPVGYRRAPSHNHKGKSADTSQQNIQKIHTKSCQMGLTGFVLRAVRQGNA